MCAPGTSASVSPESSFGQEGGGNRRKEHKGRSMRRTRKSQCRRRRRRRKLEKMLNEWATDQNTENDTLDYKFIFYNLCFKNTK